MNKKVQNSKPKTKTFGSKAVAGALKRLKSLEDYQSDHTQGNYGAWDDT